MVEVRHEVRPPWPFRLPRAGTDGVVRRSGAGLERLLHVDGEPAVVRADQPGRDVVIVRARSVDRAHADEAARRMRFALAVDDDLRPFWDAHRQDPLIGASLRRRPQLRITRRAEPFEALAWAICEQLIEYVRALDIERAIVRWHGRGVTGSDLRDLPSPAAIAALAPADLERVGLSPKRALTLRRAAAEVASGRVDLHDPDHEAGWRRLRAIPGVGRWTIDVLALHGQGRHECLPAGDLAYLKFAGRHLRGRPGARATEDEVRELFAPYGRWAALAGSHALGAPAGAASMRASPPARLHTPRSGARRR